MWKDSDYEKEISELNSKISFLKKNNQKYKELLFIIKNNIESCENKDDLWDAFQKIKNNKNVFNYDSDSGSVLCGNSRTIYNLDVIECSFDDFLRDDICQYEQ